MAAGQVSFKDNKKVKKILVAQRENPIVNRLNKTKEEKYPDLMQEKDDHLRQLRKKDQAAQQARVKHHPFLSPTHTIDMLTRHACRKRKKLASRRSARRRSGKRTTLTTKFSPRRTWRRPATKSGMRTGRTTSCSRVALALPIHPPSNDPSSLALSTLHARPPPSDPTPHLVRVRPLDLVVRRVCRRLVENIRWRSA